MNTIVNCLAAACGAVLWGLAADSVQAADPPNVLIIMADDCTFNDLPLYGGQNAKTPNIDQLAAEGLTFEHAYLSEAMCQPCRSELFTGQFPMRNGCAWNHSASRPDTISMPQRLQPAGYRVGLAGKVHVKPKSVFPFQTVEGFDPNCVRNPTRTCNLQSAAKFIAADKPFALVVALVEPHVPWVMGDASQYPPSKIKLPPNIADTKLTREAFSRYLAEITYMDDQVGQLLQMLEQSGKANDTLVLFTSEQGAQFPGCKWTNWDTGLHTALVARWPGKVAAGKRTQAIVQYADVLPTLLELADVESDPRSEVPVMDGISFLPVLLGQQDSSRRYAYGVHNNLPEGPAYPIRTISDGAYRYIRNLSPDEIYIERHLMGVQGDGKLNNPYWHSWIGQASVDARTYALARRYMRRPAEQLYHTADDPYEMHNRIDDLALADKRAELSAALDRWLKQQGDPGQPQDSIESLQAARRGQHRFVPPSEQ
ncbi:sulfatase family protein [Roseimaritima ulvae]|uniref:Arylsulfatase n=1 Tax=Roseimaritima ulvae TaxID=980254 RepID=A0A5B9QGQ7_9BACT|nr:sulfatase [Roseimaritima ulvae]QEG38277.1 Arylsulfatase precursor [Roseimaritima ulvae]